MQCVLTVSLYPGLIDIFRPEALNIGEYRGFLLICQGVLEWRHSTAQGNTSAIYGSFQGFHIVMPGMCGSIQRRSGVFAIGTWLLPIFNYTTGVDSVADLTIFFEYLFASRYLLVLLLLSGRIFAGGQRQ